MNEPAPILLAEDDEDAALLLRQALEKAKIFRRLVVVHDGREAVDYLSGKNPYVDRAQFPLPALLLLDLNMPRMNGFDVLAWLRARVSAEVFPVVMLTSSRAEADMDKARRLGADDYRIKPIAFTELVQILHELNERWVVGKAGITK